MLADITELTSEGSILTQMAGKVPNIPGLDHHGDCPVCWFPVKHWGSAVYFFNHIG